MRSTWLAGPLVSVVIAAGWLSAPVKLSAQQQHVQKSKITIYDIASKLTKVIYESNQLIEAPNWSPDGKYLLVNTGGNLYKLQVGGAGSPKLEKIDLGSLTKCNNDKSISPDGKLIAFSSSGRAHGSQVYTVGSDGGTPKLIVPQTPSYFHGFSPDGKWLAIVAKRNGNFDLFRVPVNGGEQQQLTVSTGYDDGPDYSPDGKWIYFNSNRSGSWRIWRMPSEGVEPTDKNAQQVTNGDYEDWFSALFTGWEMAGIYFFPERHGDPQRPDARRDVADDSASRERDQAQSHTDVDHVLRRPGHHQCKFVVA